MSTIWDWTGITQSADETIDKAYPRIETAKPIETEQQKQERMWEALEDMARGG